MPRMPDTERARRRIARNVERLDKDETERRAAITFALDVGIPATEIAEAYGWSSRSTVYTYRNHDPDA